MTTPEIEAALCAVLKTGDEQKLKNFLLHLHEEFPGETIESFLIRSELIANLSIIQLMFGLGLFTIHSKFAHGMPLLHYAAYHGDIETVQFLLASGAAIEATDDDGYTTLHAAARGWNGIEVVELLLRLGSHLLNFPNAWGETPLFVALTRGRFDIVRILLAVGATIGSDMDRLEPRQIKFLHQPMSPETIQMFRNRIYFNPSLSVGLLGLIRY